MGIDISAVAPLVRQILTAPGTDLETISARSVRKQLPELDESITPQFLKTHKDDIHAIIASEFEHLRPYEGQAGESSGAEEAEDRPRKRKQADSDDDAEGDEDMESPKKKLNKSPKKAAALSDAEYARQISNELNGLAGPRTRGGNKTSASKPKAKRGTRTKKSAATVDSDSDADPSASPKKSSGGPRGGFAKMKALSEPLAALLQVEQLPRTQVVKKLWEYIKANNLQNPNNGREILGDAKFKAVFQVDKLDMMRMNKLLGQHLHDI